MNILLLVSSMHGGGAERVASLLANRWCQDGHRVTVMPTFSGRGTCFYPLDPRVELLFLADLSPGGSSRAMRFWRLRQHIARTRPDKIVSFLPHVNVAALLATRGLGTPVIVSERTYPPLLDPPLDRLTNALRRLVYRFAQAVVVQTQDVATWVNLNCSGARVAVIPNPVCLPLQSGEPRISIEGTSLSEHKLILGAGRLIASKRFDILFRAFSRLAASHSDWALVLLGEGPERTSLENLAAQLGIRDRVAMPGFVGNPADWYEAANAYVLTSSYEGFPNTLVEAMAYGVPAISFDIKTGPREILRDGASGILLPDSDHVEGLTRALNLLMSDERRRQHLSDQATHVRSTYSMERVTDKWNDLLAGALV